MKNSQSKDISTYISSAPKESQSKLLEMRKLLHSLIPKADEGLSYGMPVFKLNGKSLICFAGYKKHIGFYPMSGSFLKTYKNELKNYVTSKGAVQFPLDKPLPVALVKKLVKGKMKELKGEEKIKKKPKQTKDKITKYIQYHKDGSIWGKGNLMGEKMHGYWEWFRKEGTKMRSGHFEQGKQVGEWITYDKNGRLVKKTMMK